MNCAIMQPTFNPWVGYFDMINSVDVFVFFDDVQLTKRSWQVRNRIKTASGEQLVTLPIQKCGHRQQQLIMNARIIDNGWKEKLIKSLHVNYNKSRCFREVIGFVEELICYPSECLADYNINLIETVARKIGIQTPFIRSSSLKGPRGSKDDRLASICVAIDADTYLAAAGSAAYIEKDSPGGAFPEKNISLFYQNYRPVEYSQTNGAFIPSLGVFDLLLNEGFNSALKVILAGHADNTSYLQYRQYMELQGT